MYLIDFLYLNSEVILIEALLNDTIFIFQKIVIIFNTKLIFIIIWINFANSK